jgi:hypothetical protein
MVQKRSPIGAGPSVKIVPNTAPCVWAVNAHRPCHAPGTPQVRPWCVPWCAPCYAPGRSLVRPWYPMKRPCIFTPAVAPPQGRAVIFTPATFPVPGPCRHICSSHFPVLWPGRHICSSHAPAPRPGRHTHSSHVPVPRQSVTFTPATVPSRGGSPCLLQQLSRPVACLPNQAALLRWRFVAPTLPVDTRAGAPLLYHVDGDDNDDHDDDDDGRGDDTDLI